MKTKLFVIVLLAAVAGLGACGKKETKSNKCELLEITISGQTISPQGSNFSHLFRKTDVNTWTGWRNGNPASIGADSYEISEKATISPDPKSNLNYEAGVNFTVTAEDGTTKNFNVKIQLGTL